MVVLLMKGIRNQKPPRPKYQSTWDVDMVLNYLRGQENASLSVGALASKLATLLSLATLYRASELAGIDKRSISFTAEGVSFSLSKFRKAQRGGALQSIFLKKLADEQLDPGRCLSRYCEVTEKYRTDKNSERLFIGSVGQHPHVQSSTISAWIKKELKAAGVDTERFSGHSTRGAAASKAAASGVSVESILSAGHWSAESTFTRFYRRDAAINPSTSVAGAVLSLGNIA
jgi:integrase